MSNRFQIRLAIKADIPVLVALARTTFHDTYIGTDDIKEITDYVTRHFTTENFTAILDDPNSTLFLALDGDRDVGYAHIRRAKVPTCVTGPAPVELARIYLRQEEIGKGLGARLVQIAKDEAVQRNGKTLWLCVYDKNAHAIEFYKRCGFEKVGTMGFEFGGIIYNDPVMAVSLNDKDQEISR